MYQYKCQRCGASFQNKNKGRKYCSYLCAKPHVAKTCGYCNMEFTRAGTTGKYCSQQCAKNASKKGTDCNCHHCGNVFYATARKHKKRFCSDACHVAWQAQSRPVRVCIECGKSFHKKAQAQAKFCSNACRLNGTINIRHLAEIRRLQSGKETKLEQFGYELLQRLHIKFKKQYIFGGRYVADAFLPKTNTLVQFDGDYWHGNPQKHPQLKYKSQQATWKCDRKADIVALELGLNVERFWESDLYKNTSLVENRLKRLIEVAKNGKKNP